MITWQMVVEEMNILTTVFLKANNEKVYYPNSVLATKPISNYYRSPDMVDNVDFSIDFMTPAEKIGALKENIKRFAYCIFLGKSVGYLLFSILFVSGNLNSPSLNAFVVRLCHSF